MLPNEIENEENFIVHCYRQTKLESCTLCGESIEVPKQMEVEDISCNVCGQPLIETPEKRTFLK